MIPLENCAYSYKGKKDRPIFVPTKKSRAVGYELIKILGKLYVPEPFIFHLGEDGGHVAALHRHRKNKYFAKVDLSRFFYSISRSRVKRTLKDIGVPRAEHFSRWSCVKNPYAPPSYALPYGFVQSPILATLVLSRSVVGDYLRSISNKVTISVYVDDIALSGNNKQILDRAYNKLRRMIVQSNLVINDDKSVARAQAMEVFNCSLTRKATCVTDARKAEFNTVPHTQLGEICFERYCETVAEGNE